MADPVHLQRLSRANQSFALELFRQLQPGAGNLFFSPHSLSVALAMTYAGARRRTAKQMAAALGFDLPREQLFPAFAALNARLASLQQEGLRLSEANSLYPQQGYPFRASFLKILEQHFGVSVTPVDYVAQAEAARLRINAWVAERTANKIIELIKPGVLDSLTRLVLVNAIYFKGAWLAPFDPTRTRPQPFWFSADEQQPVPMMGRSGSYPYARVEGAQLLELPYLGEQLAMLVILPDEKDGLPELQARLTQPNLESWLGGLRRTEVALWLPRFRLTSSFRLDKALVTLGMSDAFDPLKADFSGMTSDPVGLFISAAIHQAFIEVNEEGSEAAAATAVVMSLRSMPQPPVPFKADHPFIFVIRERESGAILFLGQVLNPLGQA